MDEAVLFCGLNIICILMTLLILPEQLRYPFRYEKNNRMIFNLLHHQPSQAHIIYITV